MEKEVKNVSFSCLSMLKTTLANNTPSKKHVTELSCFRKTQLSTIWKGNRKEGGEEGRERFGGVRWKSIQTARRQGGVFTHSSCL